MRREFHVRFCEGGGVRFPSATRLVILCRSEAEAQQALERVWAWTAEAGLTLHPEKTRIVDANQEGFEFLGYRFERGQRWPRGCRQQFIRGDPQLVAAAPASKPGHQIICRAKKTPTAYNGLLESQRRLMPASYSSLWTIEAWLQSKPRPDTAPERPRPTYSTSRWR